MISFSAVFRLLPILVLCQAPLWAGIPEISSLKEGESLVVQESHSEPAISTREFVFTSGKVVIKSGGKTLGSLQVTEDEAIRIDRFIDCVRRGKKSSGRGVGGSYFKITETHEGKTQGTWEYSIEEPKQSDKPVLSFPELIARLEKK